MVRHGRLMSTAGLAVPVPGTESQLDGVFCASASDCWAVGWYAASNGAKLNQALHWNGTKWSQVTTPDPGGTGGASVSELFGVRCNSSSDCWAVGWYLDTAAAELNQALHWNGTKWSLVTTPDPGGTAASDLNALFDVWCPSSGSCWAAGESGNGEADFNQALHWNGTKWSQVTTPDPAGTGTGDVNGLDGVRCTSASNCWAVGSYGNSDSSTYLNQALHWNGASWTQVTTPNPGGANIGDISSLNGLACASATSCWAAGTYGSVTPTTTTLVNEALHWDGAQWSLVSTPDPDGTGGGARNELLAANCTSASNCWAVGQYGSISGSVGTVLNEALHWDGSTWTLVPTPDPADTANLDSNILRAVRCTSASNCWAVGDAQNINSGPDLNQALHWNGTKWSAR